MNHHQQNGMTSTSQLNMLKLVANGTCTTTILPSYPIWDAPCLHLIQTRFRILTFISAWETSIPRAFPSRCLRSLDWLSVQMKIIQKGVLQVLMTHLQAQ